MTLPFKQLLLSVDRLDNPPRKTVNDYLEDAPYPFIADGLMQAIIDEGVLVRLTLLPFNKYQHGLQDVYVSLRTEGLIDKFYIRDGNSYTALDQDDNDIWQTSLAPYIVSMYVINYNTMLEHEIVNIDVNITPTPSPTPTISNTPTPSVTQSVTVTPSTTPSVSITASETVTPTPTSSLTPTPGSSLTPTPTNTPEPSVTPSETPSPSETASPTPTISNTPTSSLTPTLTQTPDVTSTPTMTPEVSPTISLTPSVTNTVTPSTSLTPSVTISDSPTPTPSVTPTLTMTPTLTESPTPTASITQTVTPSVTSTPDSTSTPTPTVSVSPSITASVTPTISLTPTNTPSVTSSSSITPSPTITLTPSVTGSITATPAVTNTPTPTTTKSLTPSPSVTPTQTPAGPELVINGTFSSGSSVPTQFSGTNCTLSINTGQMILSATANLGGPPAALLNVTGLTMTTIQSYRVMFDYIQGTTNLHFLNVKITDGTTTYYTTSTNLTGNGTFNQVVQFPAGTTRILVTMSPTDTTTGLSNTVYVAQQYPFDNFSIKRVL